MFEERRVAAWIGASLVIEGDLTSSEDTTIAGEVKGDIAVKEHKLMIAPGATIRGTIVARTVEVQGTVVGTITSDGRVEIGATGSVEGDITAPRLVLAEGATLHGKVAIAGSPGS
ncbi:MAG TPA: polymer-forming cytoskeletal protein [Longimicrobiales bacterium]|nr:polymer-forming cytoskeletal protein [Longimicrobiales bacterium]